MAGLTHHPCKSQQPKTFKPFSIHLHTFSIRILIPKTTRYPSIRTTISARYGGGAPRRSKPADEALDFSSVKSDTVRLIDQQQKMVGVVTKAQAFQMAEEAELDLCKVFRLDQSFCISTIMTSNYIEAIRPHGPIQTTMGSDRSGQIFFVGSNHINTYKHYKGLRDIVSRCRTPVVRIMDYNKYKYEQQKKKRDQQKKSMASRMDMKELKMGYNIDVHDYSVRLRAAKKFLADGDKVKIIVNLKGRENEFRNNAIELVRRFQTDVGELATEEAKSFKDRNIFIMLIPNKVVVQKSQEAPKQKDDAVANEVSASV